MRKKAISNHLNPQPKLLCSVDLDPPKRPMTAYNYFFREQRRRILEVGLEKYEAEEMEAKADDDRRKEEEDVSFGNDENSDANNHNNKNNDVDSLLLGLTTPAEPEAKRVKTVPVSSSLTPTVLGGTYNNKKLSSRRSSSDIEAASLLSALSSSMSSYSPLSPEGSSKTGGGTKRSDSSSSTMFNAEQQEVVNDVCTFGSKNMMAGVVATEGVTGTEKSPPLLLAVDSSTNKAIAANGILNRNNSNSNKKRKRRPPPHGKVSFTALGRVIAKRWKSITPKRLEKYAKLAAMDKERYQREMRAYDKACAAAICMRAAAGNNCRDRPVLLTKQAMSDLSSSGFSSSGSDRCADTTSEDRRPNKEKMSSQSKSGNKAGSSSGGPSFCSKSCSLGGEQKMAPGGGKKKVSSSKRKKAEKRGTNALCREATREAMGIANECLNKESSANAATTTPATTTMKGGADNTTVASKSYLAASPTVPTLSDMQHWPQSSLQQMPRKSRNSKEGTAASSAIIDLTGEEEQQQEEATIPGNAGMTSPAIPSAMNNSSGYNTSDGSIPANEAMSGKDEGAAGLLADMDLAAALRAGFLAGCLVAKTQRQQIIKMQSAATAHSSSSPQQGPCSLHVSSQAIITPQNHEKQAANNTITVAALLKDQQQRQKNYACHHGQLPAPTLPVASLEALLEGSLVIQPPSEATATAGSLSRLAVLEDNNGGKPNSPTLPGSTPPPAASPDIFGLSSL